MWIIELLKSVFPKGKSVKIDPDHLPGLRAPRPSPSKPLPPPMPGALDSIDIDAFYAKFLSKTTRKPLQKAKKKGRLF